MEGADEGGKEQFEDLYVILHETFEILLGASVT